MWGKMNEKTMHLFTHDTLHSSDRTGTRRSIEPFMKVWISGVQGCKGTALRISSVTGFYL